MDYAGRGGCDAKADLIIACERSAPFATSIADVSLAVVDIIIRALYGRGDVTVVSRGPGRRR